MTLPQPSLRFIIWNVEWATPTSPRGKILLRTILDRRPDIVCLTEGTIDFLPENGHVIAAEPDYGYPNPNGRRRKVLLWSREPWKDVDAAGHPDMPPGRFVQGTTTTPLGELTCHGVCIPWSRAHVHNGRRDREPWQDHLAYLASLHQILAAVPNERSTLVAGDYNQRIPRRRAPAYAFEALQRALTARFQIATTGEITGVREQAIDHLALSSDLHAHQVDGIARFAPDGRHLSDHFGLDAVLSAT